MKNLKVAIIGAGVMGHGIALVFALNGQETFLIDINEEKIDLAIRKIKNDLTTLIELGLATVEKAESGLQLLRSTTDIQEVEKADFTVEVVPEKMELKKQIFRQLDDLCPSHTVLASNTSTLSITEIASVTKRPDKVIGTHWVNPPYILPMIEVIRGEKTSKATLDLTISILRNMGKDPIVCKDVPGFIINRLQYAMMNEALHLLEQKTASAEDIDKVWTKHLGLRYSIMGPIEVLDNLGLDVVLDCYSYMYDNLKTLQFKPSEILKDKVRKGELGLKSGKGLLAYDGKSIEKIVKNRDRKFAWLLKQLRKMPI